MLNRIAAALVATLLFASSTALAASPAYMASSSPTYFMVDEDTTGSPTIKIRMPSGSLQSFCGNFLIVSSTRDPETRTQLLSLLQTGLSSGLTMSFGYNYTGVCEVQWAALFR